MHHSDMSGEERQTSPIPLYLRTFENLIEFFFLSIFLSSDSIWNLDTSNVVISPCQCLQPQTAVCARTLLK